MTITAHTYTERVLIVLNPDGTLKGAHQHKMTTYSGGAPIPDTQGDAEPLDAGTLAAVLPSNEALMAQIMAVTAERDAAVAARTEAEAARAAAEAERDALRAQLHPSDSSGFAILSPVQIRLGLLAGGITSAQVRAVIAGIEDTQQREIAETYWDYATEYHRSHSLIGMFAEALGLTNAQIDALWAHAATL